jgi:hypothetical protein
VRSRLQQRFEAGRALVYRTTGEAVSLTWQREGLRGFYKGLAPNLLRVMPQSAITLTVYEGLLQWLADADAQARQKQERAQRRDGSGGGGGGNGELAGKAASGPGEGRGQQQQHQQQRRRAELTDSMRPLVIAADSQAEQ